MPLATLEPFPSVQCSYRLIDGCFVPFPKNGEHVKVLNSEFLRSLPERETFTGLWLLDLG